MYLEPGSYYIIIDGDGSTNTEGDFTLVIGEMLDFENYSRYQSP